VSHPAASIEVAHTSKHRARVRITEHPAMPELTILTFTDGAGTTITVSLNPENLDRLSLQLDERLTAIRASDYVGVVA